jgi:hypothetical protein
LGRHGWACQCGKEVLACVARDARQGREQKQAGSEVGPFGGLQAAARGPAAPAALVCGGPSLLPPGLEPEVRAYGGRKRAVKGRVGPGRDVLVGPSKSGQARQGVGESFKVVEGLIPVFHTLLLSAASVKLINVRRERGAVALSLAAPAPPVGGPRRPHAAASGDGRTRLRPATPGPSARSARHSPPPSTGGRPLTGCRLPPWPNTGERSLWRPPRANRPDGGGLLVGFPGCRAAGHRRRSAHHDTPKSQRPAVRLRHSRHRGGGGRPRAGRSFCTAGLAAGSQCSTRQRPSSQSLRPASQSPRGAGRAERQRVPWAGVGRRIMMRGLRVGPGAEQQAGGRGPGETRVRSRGGSCPTRTPVVRVVRVVWVSRSSGCGPGPASESDAPPRQALCGPAIRGSAARRGRPSPEARLLPCSPPSEFSGYRTGSAAGRPETQTRTAADRPSPGPAPHRPIPAPAARRPSPAARG